MATSIHPTSREIIETESVAREAHRCLIGPRCAGHEAHPTALNPRMSRFHTESPSHRVTATRTAPTLLAPDPPQTTNPATRNSGIPNVEPLLPVPIPRRRRLARLGGLLVAEHALERAHLEGGAFPATCSEGDRAQCHGTLLVGASGSDAAPGVPCLRGRLCVCGLSGIGARSEAWPGVCSRQSAPVNATAIDGIDRTAGRGRGPPMRRRSRGTLCAPDSAPRGAPCVCRPQP